MAATIVVRSPPLFFVTAPLPASAKGPSFTTRNRSTLAGPHFPVFSFAARPSGTTSVARTLRATAGPQKYVYPDPIPEFAESETKMFRAELRRKLCGEIETFGGNVDAVVDVCSQIFNEFLCDEYGGPGTLQVEPFTYMMVALKDDNLPGAALAARAALLWAQNYVDRDWETWNAANPTN